MKNFTEIQSLLEKLIPMPANLPVIYLLGDTGAGKTCFVRQLLGTTNQSFPSVRRFRTTVAPTEFVITNESEFKAAFVFKEKKEVEQYVLEILEQVVEDAVTANDEREEQDLADLLSESSDQRFRLRCFVDEDTRQQLAKRIHKILAPKIRSWSNSNFSGETDLTTVIELALETEFHAELSEIHAEIMERILVRVSDVCAGGTTGHLPETFNFSSNNRNEFVEKLKIFLGLDEGAISPVLEKARVRGNLKSPLLPQATEIVITDGEGIGHDAREAKVLSARHFDYFYASDSIILVEDSETPFTRGGKSALSAISTSGYLPKLCLAFSRLDKVEQETRELQKREVNQSLRNVLNALQQDGIEVERDSLTVRYYSKMNEIQPDLESQRELISLVESIIKKHGEVRARFVAPKYDFELLAAFLANANATFRKIWAGYIWGEGAEAAKWQTQKAFTKRMSWRTEEFRFLKPVAEFRQYLVLNLQTFLANPVGWTEEITEAHKKDCLERLRQEVSNQILSYVRNEILDEKHPDWNSAAELSGTGTTPIRSRIITRVIENSAPELTGSRAIEFKDAIKLILHRSIEVCKTHSS
ncbi:MAG: hypothetical protein PHY43_07890 [Verrucomicrobiales bacterium]|nr:hypothetical protein [Verrucomicrobiales bacterium]